MDDKKSPKRKADGIRKQTDSVRSRSVDMDRASRKPREKSVVQEKFIVQKEEIVAQLPEKTSFLERSGSSVIASGGSQVMRDASFKEEVLPGRLSFLKHKNILIFFSVLGIAVVATLFLSTVFARVTITLKPAVESLQIQDTEVFFNASVSEVNGITRTIPAEFLSFDGSAAQDFETTGNEYVNQKASGRVRIYNAYATNPQALVANTRFITDEGILFRLAQAITIPAAKKGDNNTLVPQSIEIDLFADKPGEGSNITGEVKLHIPGFKGTAKYNGFYGIAEKGFSAGSVGQGRVVSHDDLSLAQQKVSKKAFDDLKHAIAEKIPANFKLVDSLSDIQITSIDGPKEKTRMDHFTVEAKALARVFVFRDTDIIKLLNEFLLKGDDTKTFIDTSADFHYQIKNANYEKKIADVNMNGSIKTKRIIATQDIANLAAGKKEGSLIEALKGRKEIGTFRLAFFPPWIFSAPANSSHVNVVIEDPATDSKSAN